jgi:hypothetical protein
VVGGWLLVGWCAVLAAVVGAGGRSYYLHIMVPYLLLVDTYIEVHKYVEVLIRYVCK